MSSFMFLLIGTQENIEEFRVNLAKILEVELKPSENPEIIAFGDAGNWSIELTENVLSLGEEQNRGPYQYYLNIEIYFAPRLEYVGRRCDVAHMIFEQLKNTGKYRLLLLENLEDILDKFDPE